MEQVLSIAVGALGSISVTAVGALAYVVKRKNHSGNPGNPGNPDLLHTLNDLSSTLKETNSVLQKVSEKFTDHDKETAVAHEALLGAIKDFRGR